MTPSETGEQEDFAEWSQAVIANIDEVFLQPEIERRGGAAEVGPVRKAVVFLEPGSGVRVLLNDEAEVLGEARVTRPIEAGEELTVDDVSEIVSVRPLEVPADAGWIAYVRLTDGSTMVAFDFRRNRGKATGLLALAEEYLATSREADAAGRLGPAIDAAHTAAELAVTAMMYLTHDVPIESARSGHSKRSQWLKQDASLGNSPTDSSRALGMLGSLRPAARYGSRPLELSDDERVWLLSEVERLVRHAQAFVGQAPSGQEPGDGSVTSGEPSA